MALKTLRMKDEGRLIRERTLLSFPMDFQTATRGDVFGAIHAQAENLRRMGLLTI
jgi:hypothetical protein